MHSPQISKFHAHWSNVNVKTWSRLKTCLSKARWNQSDRQAQLPLNRASIVNTSSPAGKWSWWHLEKNNLDDLKVSSNEKYITALMKSLTNLTAAHFSFNLYSCCQHLDLHITSLSEKLSMKLLSCDTINFLFGLGTYRKQMLYGACSFQGAWALSQVFRDPLQFFSIFLKTSSRTRPDTHESTRYS